MVLPTGGGKTVIFCYMVGSAAARGKRTVILVHRKELLDQVSSTLSRFGIAHKLCAPGHTDPDALVIVASVFSAARRLNTLHRPDFVVIDEAHHCVAKTTWGRVLGWAGDAYCIGVTATPQRLSGEGLKECFSDLVTGPTTSDLIAAGHLCDYRYFKPPTAFNPKSLRTVAGDYNVQEIEEAVNKPQITGCAVDHYEQHVNGRRAVVFCITIAHSLEVARSFAARGHSSAVLSADTHPAERGQIVADFAAGKIQILCSCNVISEGFDLPAIEAAILLRPTQSLSMYLQQVGRALRPYPGKDRAVILDHVGNVDRHGLPCAPRDWSLEGKKRKKGQKTDDIPIRVCKHCFAVNPASAKHCAECGTAMETVERKIREDKDGSLTEIDRSVPPKMPFVNRLREQREAKDLQALVALGKQRGYKWPLAWANKVLESRKNRYTTLTK